MPDITMCNVATCHLAMRCYRHANSGTKPSWRQSWATFESGPGDDCDHFVERERPNRTSERQEHGG